MSWASWSVRSGLGLAVFSLWGSSAFAQEAGYRFGHLTVEDGLSNSWVRVVKRDRRGFLWIGTQDCLNRYDGNSFRHYCGDRANPHALAASAVTAIFEDAGGRLWFGAEDLHLYDRDLDRFDRYPLGAPGEAATRDPVRAIVADGKGSLWVGTEGALFRVDAESRQVERFRHDPADGTSLSRSSVRDLLVDRQGRLWVASVGGLDRLDDDGRSFVRLFRGDDDPPPLREAFEALFQDESGTLWIGGYVLVRLDPVSGEARIVPHAPPGVFGGVRILELSGDQRGRLLVGTENAGLVAMDLATEKLQRFLPDPEEPSSLGASSIWALERDTQEILWIGTFNSGLDFVSPLGQRFTHLRARRGGLSDPHVSAVIEDRLGQLWIGTDGGGLNRLDRATGHVEVFRSRSGDETALASDAVLSLLEDSQGRVWVGTYGGGLQLFDRASGRFRRFRLRAEDSPTWGDAIVWTIAEDGRGRLLVGSERGVQVLERRGQRLSRLKDVHTGVGHQRTAAIAVGRRGDLWLAAGSQVEHFESSSGRVTRYSHGEAPSAPGVLGPEAVAALHLDTRDNLWIGCAAGLRVLAAGSRRLRRYGTAEGLPSRWIASILEDGAGNLWLGTSRGLAKIEGGVLLPESPRVQVFDSLDGVQGLEFRSGAAFRGRRGEMFFGGQRGLTSFHPGHIVLNTQPPPVVLTDLRVLGQAPAVGRPGSPLLKAISETAELTLSHAQSAVTFEFAALNLLLPQKNLYTYRLEGVDRTWSRIGREHVARYAGLRPGSYVLRVRAANNDGVWNDDGVSLRLRVLPPYWERWWFRLSVVLVLGAALARTYRRRLASQRREAELIRRYAYEDALTGVPNRRLFDDRLAQVLVRAARYKKTVGVMFLDLDGLKRINDALGHAVGDLVLKRTAERLVSCLRVADTVARFGGDEFLVLLPEIGGPEDAAMVAAKIIETLARPHDVEQRQVRATASIGVALYPAHGGEAEVLVRNADLALYRAKQRGRNCYELFDPEAPESKPRPPSPLPPAS